MKISQNLETHKKSKSPKIRRSRIALQINKKRILKKSISRILYNPSRKYQNAHYSRKQSPFTISLYFSELCCRFNLANSIQMYLSGLKIISQLAFPYTLSECALLACGIFSIVIKVFEEQQSGVINKISTTSNFQPNQIRDTEAQILYLINFVIPGLDFQQPEQVQRGIRQEQQKILWNAQFVLDASLMASQ